MSGSARATGGLRLDRPEGQAERPTVNHGRPPAFNTTDRRPPPGVPVQISRQAKSVRVAVVEVDSKQDEIKIAGLATGGCKAPANINSRPLAALNQ